MAARGNGKRPRGDKRAVHVVEKNVADTSAWLRDGLPTSEIRKKLAKRGVKPRTAHRYIAVARAHWRTERAGSQAFDVEATIARLTHLSRKYEREGEPSAVAQFEKLLADVRGVRQAQRVEVRGAIAHAVVDIPAGLPPLDLSRLSDVELGALKAAFGQLQLQAAPSEVVADATVEPADE